MAVPTSTLKLNARCSTAERRCWGGEGVECRPDHSHAERPGAAVNTSPSPAERSVLTPDPSRSMCPASARACCFSQPEDERHGCYGVP